jgi:hypothetical protein
MDFSTFSSYCISKKCLRNTIYNEKTCSRIPKQQRCFEKYNKIKEKSNKQKTDEKLDEILKNEVWMRDAGYIPKTSKVTMNNWKLICCFWKCLTEKEKIDFIENNKSMLFLCCNIDRAHIFGKGSHIDLKYEASNVLLINRLAHSRLDNFQDPITGKPITKEKRMHWFERMFFNTYKENKKNV